jgi:hypothetical protein
MISTEVSSLAAHNRGVRPDPDETRDDSKLTGFWMILDRVIKYLIG